MLSSLSNYLKQRQLIPVITVLCICVLFIILPSGFKLVFSEFFVSTVYYPFTELDGFLHDVTTSKSSNVELNQRLIQLSMNMARYMEDHYENTRLRRMLDFDLQLPYRLVPAEVIGLQPGMAVKTVVINAGIKKGVSYNMPVVSADGIVGKTIEVSENSAVVQLLIDNNCKVSVIDQNTRAMGIIRWQGGKLLEMGDVPIESGVEVGDTIVSSGLGGIFPPGLLVGSVVFTQNREATLFKDVMVKPSVDFGSLEEVFVVVYGE